jgi:hypothetical protein
MADPVQMPSYSDKSANIVMFLGFKCHDVMLLHITAELLLMFEQQQYPHIQLSSST